jgi:ribosomal protein L21E
MSNKQAKGKRAKTRSKFRRKGPKLTVNDLLNKPALNSRVLISIDSSVHAGLPASRYHGMIGIVDAVHKDCVDVQVQGSSKRLSVHPAHLRVLGGESK